jgi:Na+-transporting NADH:ubiquinone oxidoreductase subunit NqrE
MKRYGFRLWFANLLIVVSALTIIILLLGQFAPALTEPVAALLPYMALSCAAVAFLFACSEAVFLYRGWKAASRGKS